MKTYFIILAMLVGTITFGQTAKNSLLKDQVMIKNISSHLDSLTKEYDFSGAVLIAKNGRAIFSKAYGYANRADGIPNKIDTKFNVASMGKMFTAVSIMQLVQAGKINLGDKVGKYLPSYPDKAIRDSVTIYHLLTHTSGMGSFWEEYFKSPKDKFKDLNDYLPLFENQKLLFTPGKRFEYSNVGYVMLGLIIEAVTKDSYFKYVSDHIYKPCGMSNTDAYELDKVIPNLATGYEVSLEEPQQWKNNSYLNVLKGCSAGGGYSSLEDLLKFSNALQNDKLINKENMQIATTAKNGSEYGFGFEVFNINGHRVFGHTGGFPGINNELKIYSDLGYTIILLTNGNHISYWDISLYIQRNLVGPNKLTNDFDFTKNIINQTLKNGYDAGVRAKNNNPDSCTFMEYVTESFGHLTLHNGRFEKAIQLFRLDTAFSPNSPFAYNVLGNAYKIAGDKKSAITCYKKHIEHNPGDQGAIKRLQKYIEN